MERDEPRARVLRRRGWESSGTATWPGSAQALQQNPDFPYILVRNEQAGVHLAAGFAKASNRLRTFACTSSIGPGATNMITGAALATINRLPVLLLPGDIFARRNVAPVLQQLESPATQDTGVNDCFKPVSRYWDRIYRPEQLITSLPEAMRVLTSPSDCGAVTLALPQDVQTEAYDYPEELFRKRVWLIRRAEPDRVSLERAAKAIRAAKRPLIVAGGGVLMSEASQALERFRGARPESRSRRRRPGKGSLAWDHPQAVGAIGATGSLAANRLAEKADLVIGIGTRYSDFTTASMTAFQNPKVRFVNINTAEFDAYKVGAIPVVADARVALEQLGAALAGYKVSAAYAAEVAELKAKWDAEVERLFHLKRQDSDAGDKPAQSEVIGAMWEAAGERDVLLSAAGSHPGDLHKLWRTRTPNGYHMEYGYSCMGYEIPGAMGAKMADPTREVFVFLGDGTYLMMPSGDRDGGAGRHQDHHRAGGQRRVREHRQPEPVAGAGRLRDAVSQARREIGPAGRRAAGGGLCGQCAQPGGARDQSGDARRAEGGARGGEGAGAHHGDRGGDGYHGERARLRVVVGRCGGGGVGDGRACARRGCATKKARKRERHHLVRRDRRWNGCRISLTARGAHRARVRR